MKRLITFVLVFVCLCSFAQNKRILSTQLTKEVLESTIPMPGDFHPIPRLDEGYGKDLPAEFKEGYIKDAEKYLGKPWEVLPAMLFSEFVTNGNRTHYEEVNFARRTQLRTLVMGEIMEGKGRFLPDIINGVWAVCEESWWGIPAHFNNIKLPMTEPKTVALFVSETAALMAWTNYMLRDEFNKFSPLITQRIHSEIESRILRPLLVDKPWWKTGTNNWNPWICSNWLTCILLEETDRAKQIDGIQQLLECLDIFIDHYEDDGGCDEGPGYWYRAGASLCDNLILLQLASDGKIYYGDNQKIANMGKYIYKTYIGDGYYVNFADAHTIVQPAVNVLFPCGKYLKDETMMGFAAYGAEQNKFFEKPGGFGCLGRELLLLMDYDEFKQTKAIDPLISDSYFPNLGVMTARSKKNSTDGLFLAAKGGHNNESHNHNDIGNFIVYNNARPVLIDIGSGAYSAKTFGPDRYTLPQNQSDYHNVPRINGVSQSAGAQYKAKILGQKTNSREAMIQMDLSGAYPKEAEVKQWNRTIKLVRGKDVEIVEDYRLNKYVAPTTLALMTCGVPEVQQGKILIKTSEGEFVLTYSQNQLEASFEQVDLTEYGVSAWNDGLYRILLKVKSSNLKGTIKYLIKKI